MSLTSDNSRCSITSDFSIISVTNTLMAYSKYEHTNIRTASISLYTVQVVQYIIVIIIMRNEL